MSKVIGHLLVCSIFLSTGLCAQEHPQKQSRQILKRGDANVSETREGVRGQGVVQEMPRQDPAADRPVKTGFVFPRKGEVDFSRGGADFAPSLMIKEMPKQGAKKVIQYPAPAPNEKRQYMAGKTTLPPLVLGENFLANTFGWGTPNDNDMAISDSGIVLSVINSNLFIRNTATGQELPFKSLDAFIEPFNNNHGSFDPKVAYDPDANRFVMVWLVGNVDSLSRVILGFSQTEDPAQDWNIYELPGDALQSNLWSDYPMIALTENELFLTLNLLYNDSSWQTGFAETIIWQISKANGYGGTNLNSVLHSNIKWQGKALRNLCPVKGGSRLYGPDMYFISNRNFASQNDTVFLVHISDEIGSPSSQLTVKSTRSNLPYRFPPDGIQRASAQTLATNDSRNLGAFIENGTIQYVHNTKHPVNNRPTVYHGIIQSPDQPQFVAKGYLIENGSFDYAYPNISYAGLDSTDNTSVISFNHSSLDVYAGCSAVQTDGRGNYTPVLTIRDGLNYIDVLSNSSLERWGDYSGSQRRYNKPGEVWMSGYFAYPFSIYKAHAAWVAQITTDTAFYLSVGEERNNTGEVNVFPNPARDMVSVDVELEKPEYFKFDLFDISGKLVSNLLQDWVITKKNTFSFRTTDLNAGIYLLKISGTEGTNLTKKIVKE